MLVGCFLISNGPNIAVFGRVASHAHLLIVLVFRCASSLSSPWHVAHAPDSHRVPAGPMARSSFVWLLSILVVALLAWAISPLRGAPAVLLPLGVLVQEYFRRAYFKGFAGLCRRLKDATPSIEFTTEERLGFAIGAPGGRCVPLGTLSPAVRAASGLGVAICHSMTFYVTLLAETAGPGTYYASSCLPPHGVPMFVAGGARPGPRWPTRHL